MPASNDPNIVKQHYLTDDVLKVRQEIHTTYTVPKVDFVDWVLDTIKWQGGEQLLDVGCGSGNYYSTLLEKNSSVRYIGMDLSVGMLVKHPGTGEVICADAEKMPFPTDTFDVVMANHMLYHLPDLKAGLLEFRRILKPNGILIVATNSSQSMPELQVLMRRAILLLTRTAGTQVRPPAAASDLFALENGSRILSHHFYAVVRHDLPTKLVFPDTDPLMRYLESTRSLREPQLPEDVNWDDVMMVMNQQASHLVNHLGELSITKITGVLVATDGGDFISDFIKHRDSQ